MDWMQRAFATQAAWLVDQTSLNSRADLMAWVSPQLSDGAAQAFGELLPLENPEQIEAERKVANFLAHGAAPETAVRNKRTTHRISRSVDWGETYAEALYDPPLEYVDTASAARPDLPVAGAIVSLAQKWAATLRRNGFNNRAEDLERALEKAPSEWKGIRHVLDMRKLERLRASQPRLAKALRRALRLWGPLSTSHDADSFKRALAKALAREKNATSNENTLFELLVRWTIARAAIRGSSGKGASWRFEDEQIPLTDDGSGLALRRGKLRCTICKTKPSNLPGLKHVGTLDRSLQIVGCDSSTGYEPDIVVHFRHDEWPQSHLVAIGDAKNYGTSSMVSAVKDTATAYLFGFAPLFGKPKEPGSRHELGIALRPAVTLFAANSSRSAFGKCDDHQASAAERLAEKPSDLPPIVIFSRDQLFNQTELQAPNGQGTDQVESIAAELRAWFSTLTRQAKSAFTDQRAFAFENDSIYDAFSSRPNS